MKCFNQVINSLRIAIPLLFIASYLQTSDLIVTMELVLVTGALKSSVNVSFLVFEGESYSNRVHFNSIQRRISPSKIYFFINKA